MSEHITVRGFVATDPQTRVVQGGLSVGNFRLAATDRRFDRESNSWVDGRTNWFTVNMFRALALNAGASLEKGQPVVVTGRLRVRPWESGERSGTAVEIEAESIGHDLALGTADFSRSSARGGEGGASPAAAGPAGEADEADGGFAVDHEGRRVDPHTGEVLDEEGEPAPGEDDEQPAAA
ncbi:single-stranded DNA-binding protein [Citricoccus sp. SGAir0253]|uniref:single-stranded DNA-binding protein n=1 Tax=Citricoccus sp. SGAir0253 TaxID=2567881 RepID=UPI0010CD02A1|nr:single-stranded DNA-binding protein [Citricoccus sp. SGAir0253]QCU78298.1 single-stranded DNA-binding protein [Citricoccus sp. SGAir0253]